MMRYAHYTVTQLETFARCPEEYRLKYCLGMPTHTAHWSPEPTLSDALRGTVVHAVLHALVQDAALPPERAIRQALRQYGIPGTPDTSAAVQQLVQRARQWCQAHPAQTEQTELPFQLRVAYTAGAAIISGTIDLLRQTDAGWMIVDYKTDRVRAAGELDLLHQKYALQMATYAYAAHTAGCTPLVATHLLFLDADAVITTPWSEAALAQTHTTVASLLDRLAQEAYAIPAAHIPPCTRCIYATLNVCAVRRSGENG